MRKILKAMRSEKGFTLIELLVVIGILAALAGVVTLAVGRFIGAGQCQACDTDRHNVQTAVVAFMAQNQGTTPGGTAWASADLQDYVVDRPLYDWTWDGTTGNIQDSCATMVPGGVCTE
jgi:prepilin-type N-terminal cleavage/methylation domain-containing protein